MTSETPTPYYEGTVLRRRERTFKERVKAVYNHWLFAPIMYILIIANAVHSAYFIAANDDAAWVVHGVLTAISLSATAFYIIYAAWESELRGRAIDTVGRIMNDAKNKAREAEFVAAMTSVSWTDGVKK